MNTCYNEYVEDAHSSLPQNKMTFATATISGYVNWMGASTTPSGRSVVNILVSVPDKQQVGVSTSYKLSVWDKQATSAMNYIKKSQKITATGQLKVDEYALKNGDAILKLDFASIIDYGMQIIEDGEDFQRITKENASTTAKKVKQKVST